MTSDEIRDQLVTKGIADFTEIRGCTQHEIDDLERLAGRPLPLAYRQFLLAVGQQSGAFLRGTDVRYGLLAGFSDEARGLLAENDSQNALPDDAFVFYMHQGYEFGYFRLGDGDDPPIYQYIEGSGPPVLGWPSFTDYLVDVIRIHAQAVQPERDR